MDALRSALSRLRRARADLLAAAAVLAGWTLLTWGLARLLVADVWLLSAGVVLVVASVGLGPLRAIAVEGLYRLARDREGHDG